MPCGIGWSTKRSISTNHLPVRLCDRYCEDRRSFAVATKDRGLKDFVERVSFGFKPDPIANPTAAIVAVFYLLSEKVPESDIEDMIHALPHELQRA